jgi:hydrogenase maturation protease
MRAGNTKLRSLHFLRHSFLEAHGRARGREMTRIIGCGNLHRMDDGAGVLVAERLRQLGIPADVQSGSAFELIESWYKDEDVILVDAVVTGSPVGTVHVWTGKPLKVPSNPQVSSHGFGVAEAINLARILQLLPKTLTVYGIEGKEFGIDESVSPAVLKSVESVAQQIAQAIQQTEAHNRQISSSRS